MSSLSLSLFISICLYLLLTDSVSNTFRDNIGKIVGSLVHKPMFG